MFEHLPTAPFESWLLPGETIAWSTLDDSPSSLAAECEVFRVSCTVKHRKCGSQNEKETPGLNALPILNWFVRAPVQKSHDSHDL